MGHEVDEIKKVLQKWLPMGNLQAAKLATEISKEALTGYWLDNSVSDTGHCSLCGNYGVVDTTGITTPAGLIVGRKNWCICPNGQAFRKQIKGLPA